MVKSLIWLVLSPVVGVAIGVGWCVAEDVIRKRKPFKETVTETIAMVPAFFRVFAPVYGWLYLLLLLCLLFMFGMMTPFMF